MPFIHAWQRWQLTISDSTLAATTPTWETDPSRSRLQKKKKEVRTNYASTFSVSTSSTFTSLTVSPCKPRWAATHYTLHLNIYIINCLIYVWRHEQLYKCEMQPGTGEGVVVTLAVWLQVASELFHPRQLYWEDESGRGVTRPSHTSRISRTHDPRLQNNGTCRQQRQQRPALA